jgi:hypothetical protein
VNPGSQVIKTAISAAELAEVLIDAGFRAEVVREEKHPRVRSSVQGLAFSITFMSEPDGRQRYSDFSFHCPLRIRGEFPNALIETWNRTKRFARLVRNEHFLYITMDVMVAGGVTLGYLRSLCELWDQLIREVFMHLQQLAKDGSRVESPSDAAERH